MPVTVKVNILDDEFHVSCEKDEVDELMESARDLSDHMQRIRDGDKVLRLDRLAVMAALNVAHENLRLRRQINTAERDVGKLTGRINRALEEQKTSG